MKKIFGSLPVLFVAVLIQAAPEAGFTSLFDGETLKGWKQVDKKGEGYGVKQGVLFCAKGGGGRLFTEKEYSDFVFRFEFKLEDGSNNGLAIRSPLEGDPAYVAIELQILDDESKRYGGKLRPAQYHGSIYDVVPAERGALKKAGEWNEQEVTCIGRKIKVVLNGKTILDADVNQVKDPAKITKHPGLFRDRGHIGFLGHNDYLEFRNIRIRELPVSDKDNTAPEGFAAIFNGHDLSNWKGLLAGPNDNPSKRSKLSPAELQRAQAEADENMRKHWKVENGVLLFDGKGRSLATAKNYSNFEMLVDWIIPPKGDSGIYLRGTPQVQIWDPNDTANKRNKLGSGGLFNNQKNPADPIKLADKPVGEWNRFRMIMVGEKVHIFLNGVLVVDNTTLENYWERDKPVYPSEQIELQNHSNPLRFKNIYIREL